MKLAAQLVILAGREVGVEEEPPHSNCGPRVNDYKGACPDLPAHVGWPWCAAFICFLVREAMLMVGGGLNSYTFKRPTTAVAWAFPAWSLAQDNSTNTKKFPGDDILPGDIVVFTFSHIGLAVSSPSGGMVDTIEGNTDAAGSREGGGVFRKSRPLSKIKARIRFTV